MRVKLLKLLIDLIVFFTWSILII